MPEFTNPYDTGYRLEPKPWVNHGITGKEEPRPSVRNDYGRVDFEDNEGNATFTAWIQKAEAGYILRVDEHQDVNLAIETSSQLQAREVDMMQLDTALQVIAANHPDAISFTEQDPDTFGAGHFVFENEERNQRLAITEQHLGTDSSDDDRIPNSWTWEAEKYTDSDGIAGWSLTDHGSISAEHVDQLIDQVSGWVQTRAREHSTQAALHAPAAVSANPAHSPTLGY